MNCVNRRILKEKIQAIRAERYLTLPVCMSHDEFAEAVVDEEDARPGATEGLVNSQPVRADGSPDRGYYDQNYLKLQETEHGNVDHDA